MTNENQLSNDDKSAQRDACFDYYTFAIVFLVVAAPLLAVNLLGEHSQEGVVWWLFGWPFLFAHREPSWDTSGEGINPGGRFFLFHLTKARGYFDIVPFVVDITILMLVSSTIAYWRARALHKTFSLRAFIACITGLMCWVALQRGRNHFWDEGYLIDSLLVVGHASVILVLCFSSTRHYHFCGRVRRIKS